MSTKRKRGFTMIEAILALAITAALFAAIIGSTSTTIWRNRYDDTLNGVVDYLKSVYASVINVQNVRTDDEGSSIYCSISSFWDSGYITPDSTYDYDTGNDNYPGRTKCAIYGKLVTFGEDGKDTIHTYDVIGKVYDDDINVDNFTGTDDEILEALKRVGANSITVRSTSTSCKLDLAGQHNAYQPLWGARIERAADGNLYKGAVLITRSPITGTIHTYYYDVADSTIEIQKTIKNAMTSGSACTADFIAHNYDQTDGLYGAIQSGHMKTGEVSFCVGSDDAYSLNGRRRAIRFLEDGQNASAVQLVDMDEESGITCH